MRTVLIAIAAVFVALMLVGPREAEARGKVDWKRVGQSLSGARGSDTERFLFFMSRQTELAERQARALEKIAQAQEARVACP